MGKNGEGPRTGLHTEVDMIISFDIMYRVWVYSVRLDLLSVAYSNQTLNVNNKKLEFGDNEACGLVAKQQVIPRLITAFVQSTCNLLKTVAFTMWQNCYMYNS